MKIVPAYMSGLPIAPHTVGEVLNWQVKDGEVFFRVIWYGRPGVQTIHHSKVAVAQ